MFRVRVVESTKILCTQQRTGQAPVIIQRLIPMKIKVIENTQARNPAVYLNGKLLTFEQYELVEMESSKPMLGHCGVYEPTEISLLRGEHFNNGDVLVLIYPNKRYEFVLEGVHHREDRIALKEDK